MIDVTEATAIVLQHAQDFGTEQVSITDAYGRVLREPLYADRDFPPFDRVTMDGIAIQHQDFAAGQRQFPIVGIAAAGAPQQRLSQAGGCLEVMTGAMLPLGTDTVIRYEDVVIEEQSAQLMIDAIPAGKNVHLQGSDRKAGALIVAAGQSISAAEMGVAVTVGRASVSVTKLPTAIVISTGDELVEVDQNPAPYQIRRSNVHRLVATLRQAGIQPATAHLVDDLAHVKAHLKTFIDTYEVLLLSGGVSKGKFDYIPEALSSLGVKKLFHRIAQRPGKPFWFGQAPNGALVFALPGNPVSSFMCTQRYFLPWLRASLQLPARSPYHAVLTEDFSFAPDLTYFLQVKVSYNERGQTLATPAIGNGSGDLANLVEADGFLELTKGRNLYKKDEVYCYWPFR